jgi:dCMP deaminase
MPTNETNESKQLNLDLRYLRMARIWAENSYCERRKVGALVVKEKMIISDGYNGTPSGFENVCEDETNTTKPYVLHAEANAITKLARSSNNSEGATLYVTASPCIECAKLIIQAGIKRVIYAEQYRLTDGIDLLRRANIEVTYLNPLPNERRPMIVPRSLSCMAPAKISDADADPSFMSTQSGSF